MNRRVQLVLLCENYAAEVRALRAKRHIARALVVALDQDTRSAGERELEPANALSAAGLDPRAVDEPVIHVIPARNIETWLTYLGGGTVDETAEYQKLEHERDCAPMARALKHMCDARVLRSPEPTSLARTCVEYRRLGD